MDEEKQEIGISTNKLLVAIIFLLLAGGLYYLWLSQSNYIQIRCNDNFTVFTSSSSLVNGDKLAITGTFILPESKNSEMQIMYTNKTMYINTTNCWKEKASKENIEAYGKYVK